MVVFGININNISIINTELITLIIVVVVVLKYYYLERSDLENFARTREL